MWKSLKGLFVTNGRAPESQNGGAGAGPPASSPSSSAPATEQDQAKPNASARQGEEGQIDDKFVKVLMQAMEAKNLPGFDYLEYKRSLQKLKEMDFTEDVRYKTAFVTGQSMGVKRKDLEESAQHYLEALASEERKFSRAVLKQRREKIAGREDQLAALAKQIAEGEGEIRRIQERLSRLKADRDKVRGSIDSSASKLARTEADFKATYHVIVDSIRQDLNKIRQYIE